MEIKKIQLCIDTKIEKLMKYYFFDNHKEGVWV